MAARSGKKETKTTTTRVKNVVGKVVPPATPTPKKTKKKVVAEDRHTSEPSPKKIKKKERSGNRHASLKQILIAKREALIQQIKQQLGQSVSEEQQRRLEAAMDSGDQALVDLEREMGISLQEMRNRERQLIDDALDSLDEGTYGMCADCGEEISEKRLHALPFARLCVECQSKRELLEKIERSEQRS
jgi:DnaK suppressor protein